MLIRINMVLFGLHKKYYSIIEKNHNLYLFNININVSER